MADFAITVAWWAWPLALLIPAGLYAAYDRITDSSGFGQGFTGACVLLLASVAALGWWAAGMVVWVLYAG